MTKKKTKKRKRQTQSSMSSSSLELAEDGNAEASNSDLTTRHRCNKTKMATRMENNSSSNRGLHMIRNMLGGRHIKVYYLRDFLYEYVPSVEFASSMTTSDDNTTTITMNRIWNTIISPDATFLLPQSSAPAGSSRDSRMSSSRMTGILSKPDCRESVSSLVDNVIWSLIQRRERLKKPFIKKSKRKVNGKDKAATKVGINGGNVLVQGYIASSDDPQQTAFSSIQSSAGGGGAPCPNMPCGGGSNIICIHPNKNVSFIKTSNYFQLLHKLVGDNALRQILLHTRMFIPIIDNDVGVISKDSDDNKNKTNSRSHKIADVNSNNSYFLVCGSPPNLRKASENNNNNKKKGKKRKRMKGDEDNSEDVNDVDLTSSSNGGSGIRQRHPKQRQKRKRKRHASLSDELKMRPNSVISRHSLFYSNSYIPHVGLSSKHVLNHVKKTNKKNNNANALNGGRATCPNLDSSTSQSDDVSRCDSSTATDKANTNETETIIKSTADDESAEKLLHLMVDLHYKASQNDINMTKKRQVFMFKRKRKRWKRLRTMGIDLCRRIQFNHKKCDYHRILNRYCPIPREYCGGGVSTNNAAITLSNLAMKYTPSVGVVSFVTSTLRKVFPIEFWGNEYNFSKVIECVTLFVNLRRKEKLPNKRLLHGIKVNKINWLQSGNDIHDGNNGTSNGRRNLSRTDHEATTRLTLNVLRWVFRSFIIPLLRTNFHVTETEFSSQKVMYYRKPIWSLFRSLSIRKFTSTNGNITSSTTTNNRQQFTEIQMFEVLQRYATCQLGISRLRLLPKGTGVRPILQLSKRESCLLVDLRSTSNRNKKIRKKSDDKQLDRPVRIGKKRRPASSNMSTTLPSILDDRRVNLYRPSVNTTLGDLFKVLKYECKKQPAACGAGLESLGDFYPQYLEFIRTIKAEQDPSKKLHLYFGSVDIEKCYDNIKQDHLLKLTRNHVTAEDYLIQEENVLQTIGDFQQGGGRRIIHKLRQEIGPPESYDPFHRSIARASSESQTCGSVLLGTALCSLAKRGNLLEQLQEHLKHNLLVSAGRYGNRYFIQNDGIAQGSILSTLLCNLYYGDVEKQVLIDEGHAPFDSPSVETTLSIPHRKLLARLVDDFIFITTRKDELSSFIRKMSKGKPELGAKINKEKTVLSTSIEGMEVNQEGLSANRSHRDDPDTTITCSVSRTKMFPWCGMLFDTGTGEVRVDYSRFANSKARDSLTVDRAGDEGQRLQIRMIGFVRPRCQAILFDSFINGFRVVVTNYYQMMLLGAIKTLEYINSSDLKFENPASVSHFLRCVEQVSHGALGFIRCALKKGRASSSGKFCLSTNTATWLCWKAFDFIFCQQPGLEELCSALSSELSRKGVHLALLGIVKGALRELNDVGLLPLKVGK